MGCHFLLHRIQWHFSNFQEKISQPAVLNPDNITANTIKTSSDIKDWVHHSQALRNKIIKEYICISPKLSVSHRPSLLILSYYFWIMLSTKQRILFPKLSIYLPSFPSPAAAKSLQSCPTLCDPIDGSPPGSPVPGILQARTLEWVAMSFSNAWKWKVKVKWLSCVWLFATPWTAARPSK